MQPELKVGDVVEFNGGSGNQILITRIIWYQMEGEDDEKCMLIDGIYPDGCTVMDCQISSGDVIHVKKVGERPDLIELISSLSDPVSGYHIIDNEQSKIIHLYLKEGE